ncbi:hypothetical protein O181_026512 [Austropuccinia psidii MF-1]|uniref:Uncharacterized protein n=1 Tax=Austropuccinia psidii MF-1 TaxID=1389203 RepID=A0A9Q3CQQ9_9BASI|nr:hypothetical protein [Austropuccinia psidii MF-1]
MGNNIKPLKGGHKLQLKHQELSWLGKDYRALRRLEPNFMQRANKANWELGEDSNYFGLGAREGTGNDGNFAQRRTCSIKQLQNSPKTHKNKPKGAQNKQRIKKPGKEKANYTDLT